MQKVKIEGIKNRFTYGDMSVEAERWKDGQSIYFSELIQSGTAEEIENLGIILIEIANFYKDK